MTIPHYAATLCPASHRVVAAEQTTLESNGLPGGLRCLDCPECGREVFAAASWRSEKLRIADHLALAVGEEAQR